MAVPEHKKFDGKLYYRSRWEQRKKVANTSAKTLRKRGFRVRITEEAGGYRLWARK